MDPLPQEMHQWTNKTWQGISEIMDLKKSMDPTYVAWSWWKEKDIDSIGPVSHPPLYLGWVSSSTECEASRGMHMEHWGREGTPAQSDKSAKIILTSNGVTDVD